MRLRFVALCFLVVAFALPACAEQDMVQFGSTIRVAQGQTVQDAVCFFCSVENRGTINGDVVVFFGDVHLDGDAKHDVVDFFGSVRASDNSTIGEDLVDFFGPIRLGDNVTVGQDIVSMFGSFYAAPTAKNGGDRVTPPAWLFWGPLAALFLVIYFAVHEIRTYRHRRLYARGYPIPPPPRP